MNYIYFFLDNFWPIMFYLGLAFAPIALLLAELGNQRDNKYREYESLKWCILDDYLKYQQEHNYSEKKALRRFFKNKCNYDRAKELCTESEWCSKYYSPSLSDDDLRKKREYSYKYEDVVYEVFGKWGYRLSSDEWLIHKQLTSQFIITEVAKLLRLSLCESIRLFDEFIENGLLQRYEWNLDLYIMGYTLHNWDYVSSRDKSFSQWKNRKSISHQPQSVFVEFIRNFGDYEIINKDRQWLIVFVKGEYNKLQIVIDDAFTIERIKHNDKDYLDGVLFGGDASPKRKEDIQHFLSDYQECLYVSYSYKGHLSLMTDLYLYKRIVNTKHM